ncbi:MAG: OsmC family protein [Alphaproteobacteria bacterium]
MLYNQSLIKEGELIISENKSLGIYVNDAQSQKHHMLIDEPKHMGGDDLSFSPYDMLAAALGGCTSITLRMYAEHKKWPLEHVSVKVKHHKDEQKQDIFVREIIIKGKLLDEQKQRLLEIANKCPVYRTLASSSKIESCLM